MIDEMKFSNKHFQLRIEEIEDGMATVQVTMHKPFEIRIDKHDFDKVNDISDALMELTNSYYIERLFDEAIEQSEKEALKAIGANQFTEVV